MAENHETRGADLNQFTQGIIYGLYTYAEWKPQAISQKLSISINTIKAFCKKSKKVPIDQLNTRPNCGRSRSTSSNTDRQLVRASMEDPFKTAVEIRKEFSDITNVTPQTVRNRLIEAGLGAHTPAHKTLLTEGHKERRLAWAETQRSSENPQI